MSTTTGNSGTPITPPVEFGTAINSPTRATPRVLVATDSLAMKFALSLCGEIFPGAPVDVEILSDPEDPERSWYCLNIHWPGEPRDCITRSSRWYDRFDAEHREHLADFSVSVIPV